MIGLVTQGSQDQLTGIAGWAVDVMEKLGGPGAGAIVALENLFPPIPSEVVLPLAGFTASQGKMTLVGAIFWTTLGSVVGALLLYGIGAWLGRDRLLRVVDWMPGVDVADVEKAEAWFDRHGKSAVFLGRMVPLIRSLISIPAGLERMPIGLFTLLTAIGSLIWNSVLIGAGYALGDQWGKVEGYVKYLQYAVIAAILVLLVAFVVKKLRKRHQGVADVVPDPYGKDESHDL